MSSRHGESGPPSCRVRIQEPRDLRLRFCEGRDTTVPRHVGIGLEGREHFDCIGLAQPTQPGRPFLSHTASRGALAAILAHEGDACRVVHGVTKRPGWAPPMYSGNSGTELCIGPGAESPSHLLLEAELSGVPITRPEHTGTRPQLHTLKRNSTAFRHIPTYEFVTDARTGVHAAMARA